MLKSLLIFLVGFLFGAGTIGITVSAETKDIPTTTETLNFFENKTQELEKQITDQDEVKYLTLKTLKNRELLQQITK